MTYTVTATLKFPSCYNSGYEFTVFASTRKEAIKLGRKQLAREGYHDRHFGPLSWSATRDY